MREATSWSETDCPALRTIDSATFTPKAFQVLITNKFVERKRHASTPQHE